mmetsp:Transcript_26646/g.41507  ORF Transcript_26646/g.41507 Transcript_26646/m.41507 type:complete len:135 (-) Transcript_26646:94-498(-)
MLGFQGYSGGKGKGWGKVVPPAAGVHYAPAANTFDKPRQWSKGVGCVEFSTPAEAEVAINTLNGTELDGRQLKLEHWTGAKGARVLGDDACKVHVSNLNYHTRMWKLRQHFECCGEVKFARVMMDNTGKGKGKW